MTIQFKTIVSVLLTTCVPTLLLAQEATPRPSLPPLTLSLTSNVYPAQAQRAGVQGRVLVAFNIKKNGVPDELLIMNADPIGQFDDVALSLVKKVRFDVPKNWKESGVAQRYQLSVLFKLSPCASPGCITPKMHEVADDFLIVAAERPVN